MAHICGADGLRIQFAGPTPVERAHLFDGQDLRNVQGTQQKLDLLERLADKAVRPKYGEVSPRFFHNKGTCHVGRDPHGEPTLTFLGADQEGFLIRFDSEQTLFTSNLVGKVDWAQADHETIAPDGITGYLLNRSHLLGEKLKFRNALRSLGAVLLAFCLVLLAVRLSR